MHTLFATQKDAATSKLAKERDTERDKVAKLEHEIARLQSIVKSETHENDSYYAYDMGNENESERERESTSEREREGGGKGGSQTNERERASMRVKPNSTHNAHKNTADVPDASNTSANVSTMQILVNKVTESEKTIVTEAVEAQHAAMLNSSMPEEKELSKSVPEKVQEEREKMMIQEPVINGNVAAETKQTQQDLEKEKTEKHEKQEPTEQIVKLSTTVAVDRMVNVKTIAALAAAQKADSASASVSSSNYSNKLDNLVIGKKDKESPIKSQATHKHTHSYARMEEECVYICIYIYIYVYIQPVPEQMRLKGGYDS